MSSDSLKLEKHLCRCCHAEGCFKTLGVSFDAESSGVVYSDMIRDYLDINLTPVAGPLCLVTYTICEECVSRLHDCVSFKKQVLACEERFRDMYRRDLIKVQNPDLAANIKLEIDIQDIPSTYVEALKVECPKQDVEDFAQESDFDYQDDIDLDELPNQDDSTKINLEMSEDNLTKVEDLKKKEKGKGKAKATKTTKKVAKPKKSALSEPGEKKAKKGLQDVDKYMAYFKVISGKKNYACNKCNAKYKGFYAIKRHIERRHFPVKCPLCDETFKNNTLKKEHLVRTHGQEEFCDDSTRTVQLRAATKVFCDICEKGFIYMKYLRQHVANIHKEVTCKVCHLTMLKNKYMTHKESHSVSRFSCGICGFQTRTEYKLIRHQRRVHLQEKDYACEHCDMKFFNRSALTAHLVRHNPKKRFECGYCGKTFPRRNTLNEHVKIHTGVKKKVCNICGDRFVQKASLNYHMTKRHPDAC